MYRHNSHSGHHSEVSQGIGIDPKVGEEFKPFCFVLVLALVFKKRQKQKRKEIKSFCFVSVLVSKKKKKHIRNFKN